MPTKSKAFLPSLFIAGALSGVALKSVLPVAASPPAWNALQIDPGRGLKFIVTVTGPKGPVVRQVGFSADNKTWIMNRDMKAYRPVPEKMQRDIAALVADITELLGSVEAIARTPEIQNGK